MNITTQPRRVILFMAFLLLTAAVTFLFLGEIYSNWDDTSCKIYDAAYFYNGDTTRIVVKKPDNSEITNQDMDNFNTIKYVRMADRNDYANDINYFFTVGTDYEFIYRPKEDEQSSNRLQLVKRLLYTNFMKSSTCIKDEDLIAGHLPTARNEVVIYSEDHSLLGTKMPCYFSSQNIWGYDEFYETDVTIVGLLRENLNQVFFSEELCNMLTVKNYYDNYYLAADKNILTNQYRTNISFYPVIGEDLEYGQVRISMDLSGAKSALPGEAVVTAGISGMEYTYDAMVLDNYHESTMRFVEINEKWFKELFQQDSLQASVYIKDYIYTDYVLKQLKKMGYEAISSFRFSAHGYNQQALNTRNGIILRAILVLLMISILEILIVRAIMKIRNQDFMVLGSLGMKHNTVKLINFYEMYIYTAFSLFVTVAAVNVANLFKFDYLTNMIKYYNVFTYAIYIVLNFVVITSTVLLFNRYLKRRQKLE